MLGKKAVSLKYSEVKFNDVKNGIIWLGGLNAGGLLGVNPGALVNYMKLKFWCVYTAGPIRGIRAELSESVIVLYKNAKSLSMHYVAGIGTGNRGVGGSFGFYNTGYSDIDGKQMSIWKFIDKIKSKGNTPMYFIGVYGKKGW